MKKYLLILIIALGITIGIWVYNHRGPNFGVSLLTVPQGGTGASTLTGCLTGHGTSAITGSGSACGSGSGISFTPATTYNQLVYATSTPTLWFQNGLFASSTSYMEDLNVHSASDTIILTSAALNYSMIYNPVSGLTLNDLDGGAQFYGGASRDGTTGGTVSLYGGTGGANSDGGDITFQPGAKNGSGTNGTIQLTDPVSLFFATLDISTLSANRVFTFPNVSGTLCIVGQTCDGAGGGGTFPFTVQSWGNSTSTTLGFLNGFISTASSTFPYLGTGGLGVNNGLLYSGATTTAGTGLTYSSNSFNVNTTQNITTLSGLTTAGTVNNTAGGVLYSTGTTTPTVTAPITYSGTLGQFIGGASGAFDCTSASASVKGCITAASFSKHDSATTTFSTGLTYTTATNAVTVNTSQNIATLSNLTTNGYVKTGGGAGTLSVQTVPIPIADGGSNATTYIARTPLVFDGTRIVGTSTNPFYVDSLVATSTSLNSTFAGKLGVATTSPYTALAVAGTTTISAVPGDYPYLRVGTGTPMYGWLPNYVADFGGDITGFLSFNVYNNNRGTCSSADVTTANDASVSAFLGFVDIGHTSQKYNGTGCGTYDIQLPTVIGNSSYIFDPTGNISMIMGSTSPNAYFNWVGQNYAVETMRLTNIGLLGLGTTTPYAGQLTVASTTGPQLAISYGAGINQWTIANEGGNLYFSTTTVTGEATTTTAALELRNSGNSQLGIGTSSPSATLAVSTVAGTDAFAVGSSTSNYLLINKLGKIFMPKLTVDAAAHTYTVCGEAATFELRLDTTTCVLSALKWKENVGNLDIGLKELMKVRPVVFNWKPTGDATYDNNINIKHQQMGLIADEVATIDTRLITYDQNGEIKGFNYEFYTAWLTKAIQELAVMKGVARSAEENYQWIAMFLMFCWIIRLEIKIRK